MPREPRIYLENALYLVTAKGDEERDLFYDAEDFNAYFKALSEYKREYGFKLFAFSLLPKSLYLLIELRNNVTISQIMHDLNSGYTKAYNGRYGKKGHLFQSRFKSVIVQKENYLLRLTRYIHLLPKDSEHPDPSKYPYSSCSLYISDGQGHPRNPEMPEMNFEINEVLSQFADMETETNRRRAYENYVHAAEDQEVAAVAKLLHRKAFVGSNEFIEKVEDEVKQHVIEEEQTRIVRKTNPVFAVAGALIILFLGFVAYNFYNNQSELQQTLNKTASGFETAREDLARRVTTLQSQVYGFEQKENYGLGGFAWELQFMPVAQGAPGETFTDRLQFKGGKIISSGLVARGFSPFDYTITQESHGKMIWKTSQTNAEGTTVRWYGVVTGDQMRGVLSEIPVQGQNRDFAFVSLGRVKEAGRTDNAI